MSERTDWERVLARIGALAIALLTPRWEEDMSRFHATMNVYEQLIALVRDDPEGRAAVERMVAE